MLRPTELWAQRLAFMLRKKSICLRSPSFLGASVASFSSRNHQKVQWFAHILQLKRPRHPHLLVRLKELGLLPLAVTLSSLMSSQTSQTPQDNTSCGLRDNIYQCRGLRISRAPGKRKWGKMPLCSHGTGNCLLEKPSLWTSDEC